MTTTGQLIASLSGLPSGSALAHLTAVTTGTGTGETIYAPRLIVTTTQQQIRLTQRAKRSTPQHAVVTPSQKQKQTGKYAYATTRETALSILTQPDEVSVMMTSESVL